MTKITNFSVYAKSNGVLLGPAMPGASGAVFLNQLQSRAWSELQKVGRMARFEGDDIVEYMGWEGPAGARVRDERERLLLSVDKVVYKCEDARIRGISGAEALEIEWRDYRQALRDIPETFGDAGLVIWPSQPSKPDF